MGETEVTLSKRLLQAALLMAVTFSADMAVADSRQQMLDRLEQLDRLDHADFLDGLDEAGKCTAQRNFSCADASLRRIKPLARSADDERLFALAANNLQREKDQVAEEERLQREESERAEREEQRLVAEARAEEERQQRAEAEEEKRRALQYGLNSMAIAIGGRNMAPDQLNALLEANKRDYEQGGNGSNLRASLDQLRADNERRLQASQQKIREQQAQRQREQEELRQTMARQRESAQTVSSRVASVSTTSAPRAVAELSAAQRQQQEKARQEQLAQQAAEKKHQEEAAALAEQQRQQELAQKKAEREAKKAAEEARKASEKAEAERAKQNYLQQLTTGITLRARTCPGPGYYIVGIRPKIKPEVVSCVDIRYGTRCPGEARYTEAVGKNFIGISTDCFMGDTYQVQPKPACPADQVEVKVLSVSGCQ